MTPAHSSSPSVSLNEEIISTIRRALKEDIRSGDVTTQAIIAPEAKAKAQIIAKQSGVIAGLTVAKAVLLS